MYLNNVKKKISLFSMYTHNKLLAIFNEKNKDISKKKKLVNRYFPMSESRI